MNYPTIAWSLLITPLMITLFTHGMESPKTINKTLHISSKPFSKVNSTQQIISEKTVPKITHIQHKEPSPIIVPKTGSSRRRSSSNDTPDLNQSIKKTERLTLSL